MAFCIEDNMKTDSNSVKYPKMEVECSSGMVRKGFSSLKKPAALESGLPVTGKDIGYSFRLTPYRIRRGVLSWCMDDRPQQSATGLHQQR